MLLAAALPLLTNLELRVEGVELELYPVPLPDVYCGHPLLVAGKYTGTWPDTATISGTLATGEGEGGGCGEGSRWGGSASILTGGLPAGAT
jgi:hypothetical protein